MQLYKINPFKKLKETEIDSLRNSIQIPPGLYLYFFFYFIFFTVFWLYCYFCLDIFTHCSGHKEMHPKETLFLIGRHMWTRSAFRGLCTQRSRVIPADPVRGGVNSSARLALVAAHNICGCCLQLFWAGCAHSQSLQPGHGERVPPLSPVAVPEPLQGPPGGPERDGLVVSAAVVQSLDLLGRGAVVRLHHALHHPLPAAIDEALPPAGAPLAGGLVLLTPLPVHPRHAGLGEAEPVHCFRDAAAGAPGSHYHPPLEVTQVRRLSHVTPLGPAGTPHTLALCQQQNKVTNKAFFFFCGFVDYQRLIVALLSWLHDFFFNLSSSVTDTSCLTPGTYCKFCICFK